MRVFDRIHSQLGRGDHKLGWHGVENDAGAEILTLWQLVKNVPDIQDPETQWKTVMSGADNFNRA